MNGRRTEASTHTVLIIDADKRLIEEHPAVPASDVAPLIADLQARHGAQVRVIVDGVKGSRAPLTILPGLVLHGDGNAFRPELDAILRGGGALTL